MFKLIVLSLVFLILCYENLARTPGGLTEAPISVGDEVMDSDVEECGENEEQGLISFLLYLCL